MELLIVIMILAIIAGMTMMALAGAAEQAREQRTRAIINKIDQLIREKYESYRTRAVPVRIPPALSGQTGGGIYSARVRLYALRELMRLEMPDRISDLCTAQEVTDLQSGDSTLNAIANRNDALRSVLFSGVQIPMPAIAKNYKRQAQRIIAAGSNGWSTSNQGAECLYLIISAMKDGDKSALDFFTDTEIGDVDADGFKEILDGWGTPIVFLRWAPGYTIENGAVTLQTSDFSLAPDPFDPLKCDPRYRNPNSVQKPYALWPLLFSAGKDKVFDVGVDNTAGQPLVYANTAGGGTDVRNWMVPPNDPYFSVAPLVGIPADSNGDGTADGAADNITNHYQATP